MVDELIVRNLGRRDYSSVYESMHCFTNLRKEDTIDEVWMLEHEPVFTQGQSGKSEHILSATTKIPFFQSDRGGQITYHGPGQIIIYFLIDLLRKRIGVRDLVSYLEDIVVSTLSYYGIDSKPKLGFPGVYVDDKKVCSLGLRVRRGCSLHGLALNVDMELTPFLHINPCGCQGIEMTQVKDLGGPDSIETIKKKIASELILILGYDKIIYSVEN